MEQTLARTKQATGAEGLRCPLQTGTTTKLPPRCGLKATSSTALTSSPGRKRALRAGAVIPLHVSVRKFLAVAEGDHVVLHGRFSGHGQTAADDRREHSSHRERAIGGHWDVIQDEATAAEAKSGLPMIGDRFLVLK